ncbi:hypothetical protein ACHAQA_007911 [Verticillium albo-atrum]
MRANTLSLSATALLGLLTVGHGKPTGKHYHRARHAEQQMAVEDASVSAPTKVPQVVVYMNEDGTPKRTATEDVLLVPIETKVVSLEAVESAVSATPALGSDSPAATAASSNSSSSGGSLSGIAYAPYTSSGDCKTADQVHDDFSMFKGQYSLVRIYGTDCEQVTKVVPAAKDAGLKVFLGIFELAGIEKQVADIVDTVGDDWSTIDTVSVGNELVNNKAATASQMVAAMSQTRSLLRAAGYEGPVVTVDTFVAVRDHPELCDESDYCAMNVHPFFDGNTPADEAGSFITRMVSEVQSKLSNKSQRMVVSETGWPWQGTVNRAAVPGRNQQHIAIDSIKTAFADHPSDLILFSAFNDPWKPVSADTFHAEQFWGIDGLDSSS